MKKMRIIAAWLLAAVMMMPSVTLGESATDSEIEAILNRMTLEEKVGQMMVVSFRVWKEIPAETNEESATVENTEQEIPSVKITELNDEIRKCLRDYHFGGALLFADNCRDAEQTLRLVADLQTANQAGGGLPLLVSTDQEGGTVARLGFGTTGVGNMALAATGSPEYASQMAAVYGEELGLLGIHADYAPVMDVNNNPNNPVIGVRSFSDDPETAAEYGAAFIQGLHSKGTISTLKHFPGHGNTDTDSHTGFPCIDRSYEELKAVELVPFQAAINSGADMIMTAHIQYPQIETETYTSASTGERVYLPATMSKTILTDILRGHMGFEGVIVSDALDMAAIHDNFTDEDVLKYTINAGVNMLILPIIYDTDLFQRNKDMVDAAVRLAENGGIDIERVNDSVRRILKLKKKYGLLDQTDFTVTDEQVAAALNGAGSAEHRDLAWQIAGQALTLVKNEKEAFPLDVKDGDKTLILFSDSCASRFAAGELAKQWLMEKGLLHENAEITTLVHTRENDEECLQTSREADHVILINRMYASACLDPNTEDGFSTAIFDRIIAERHAAGRTVIFISCQLPYDAVRFPDADAILLAYGSSIMRAVPPESGEGSAYAPNLPAAICACFGAFDAPGKLPVNLPKLNEQYQLIEEILYPRAEASATVELTAFAYAHDPRDNPKAMKDIVVNPAAVYGFSPSPESPRLKDYADAIDWTDPQQVAEARAQRQAYHDSMSELYRLIEDMLLEAKPVEEIARAVSQRRNELRLEAYADDPEGLELVKKSNLETYGDEIGPSADFLYKKYGSWQTVLEKALGTNAGMDACLGFYDAYYDFYDIE